MTPLAAAKVILGAAEKARGLHCCDVPIFAAMVVLAQAEVDRQRQGRLIPNDDEHGKAVQVLSRAADDDSTATEGKGGANGKASRKSKTKPG